MIQVILRKGVLCSHFVCDTCREPIVDVAGALIAMPDCFDLKAARTGIPAYHVHKGACREAIERRYGATNYGDLELRDHIASLLVNAHWTEEEWKRATDGYCNRFVSEQDETPPDCL